MSSLLKKLISPMYNVNPRLRIWLARGGYLPFDQGLDYIKYANGRYLEAGMVAQLQKHGYATKGNAGNINTVIMEKNNEGAILHIKDTFVDSVEFVRKES